jgi:DNA-binding PadR family transcriptional regulator
MSVAKCVVLGLLAERPGYPYELARRLERRIGPAWQVNDGHLYLAVADLEKQGLIEPSPSPSEHACAKGRRRVMRLTQNGREELERWFASPVQEDLGRIRSELAAKLLLTDAAHAKVVLADLQRYEQGRIEEANELVDSRAALPATIDWAEALVELLREAALSERLAEMQWLRSAREMLMHLATQDPPLNERRDTARATAAWGHWDERLPEMLAGLRARHDELLRGETPLAATP